MVRKYESVDPASGLKKWRIPPLALLFIFASLLIPSARGTSEVAFGNQESNLNDQVHIQEKNISIKRMEWRKLGIFIDYGNPSSNEAHLPKSPSKNPTKP